MCVHMLHSGMLLAVVLRSISKIILKSVTYACFFKKQENEQIIPNVSESKKIINTRTET